MACFLRVGTRGLSSDSFSDGWQLSGMGPVYHGTFVVIRMGKVSGPESGDSSPHRGDSLKLRLSSVYPFFVAGAQSLDIASSGSYMVRVAIVPCYSQVF